MSGDRKFASEAELAAAVATWAETEGWDVYKEVHTGDGDIDLVLCQGKLIWAIETKMNLGNKVLEQAYNRRPYAHQVSVAYPDRRGDPSMVVDHFVKAFGIGLLTVTHPDDCRWRTAAVPGRPGWHQQEATKDVDWSFVVHEERAPRILRPSSLRRRDRAEVARQIGEIRAFLRPEHKALIAGAPNGGQLTPWRVTILRIQEFLRANGPSTVKEIVAGANYHYSNDRSAQAGVARILSLFETPPPGEPRLFQKVGGVPVRWVAVDSPSSA